MNVTTIAHTAYCVLYLSIALYEEKKNRKFAARIYLVRISVAVNTIQRRMKKKKHNLY